MKKFLFGLLIGAFIGIGLGMAWRIEQERTYIIPQIYQECDEEIQFHQNQVKSFKKLISSQLFKEKK